MDNPNIVRCPNCGAGNKAGSAVCRMCATPLGQSGAQVDAQTDRAASRESEGPQSHNENQQETTYPVDAKIINCSDCNAENELGWAFCQQCGHKLPQTMPAPPQPPQPPPVERPAAQGMKTTPNAQPEIERPAKKSF